MPRATLKRQFIVLLFGAIGLAACANADRVTGKNSGGSLVIRSERDTTLAIDTLIVGDKDWLQVMGADTTAAINWAVSDTSIVGILELYFYRVHLSALRAGQVTVTAHHDGETGTFELVVRDSRPSDDAVARVQITTPTSDTAVVGDSVPFGFNIWSGRGDPMFGVPFRLTLSDSTLVRVAGGLGEHSFWFHMLKVGALTVTVTAAGKSAEAQIVVK